MRLGRFEVLGKIADGGTASVLEGVAPDGRRVAIKLLRGLDPEAAARFEREQRLLASLGDTAGFVPVLDAGTAPEGAWLALPLLRGGTLRERLRRGGALPLDAGLALGRRLATALGQAHERGILHRDLKPENVLFTEDGEPLVGDLGLGKRVLESAARGANSLTDPGTAAGTLGYMAPEQLQDARRVGPEADVFALGALVHEALSGTAPFDASGVLAFARAVERGPPTLREKGVAAPPWLEEVLARALDADPARRFADARALAHALEGPEPAPPARRGAALVAGLALACVAAGAWIALARGPDAGGGTAAVPAPSGSPASSPRSPLLDAEAAFARGHFIEARDVSGRVLAKAPNDLAARALRSRAHHELGATAAEAEDDAVLFAARPVETALVRSATVSLQRDLLGARPDPRVGAVVVAGWSAVIEAVPEEALAWFGRGYVRAYLGDWTGARADIGRACDLAPGNANYRAHLGWTAALRQRPDYDLAIPDYDRALQIDPGLALAWRWRGEARWWKGDRAGAVADWKQGLAALGSETGPARDFLVRDLEAAGVRVGR